MNHDNDANQSPDEKPGIATVAAGGTLPELAGRRRRRRSTDHAGHGKAIPDDSSSGIGEGSKPAGSESAKLGELETGNTGVSGVTDQWSGEAGGGSGEIRKDGALPLTIGGDHDGGGTTSASASARASARATSATSASAPSGDTEKTITLGDFPLNEDSTALEGSAPVRGRGGARKAKAAGASPAASPAVAGASSAGLEALLPGGLDAVVSMLLQEMFGVVAMYRGDHWRIDPARLDPVAKNFASEIRSRLPAVASRLEQQSALTAGCIQLGAIVAPIVAAEISFYASQRQQEVKTENV